MSYFDADRMIPETTSGNAIELGIFERCHEYGLELQLIPAQVREAGSEPVPGDI
jgi:hypothetical protein